MIFLTLSTAYSVMDYPSYSPPSLRVRDIFDVLSAYISGLAACHKRSEVNEEKRDQVVGGERLNQLKAHRR
jgi:hypothetical protein